MDLDNALIYYRGSVDDQVLMRAKTSLEQQLSVSSKIVRKMFAVFVELAQNISRHSPECNYFGKEKDDNGVGFIRVYSEEDVYYLHAGNWIMRKEAGELEEKCRQLNAMSYAELRKMKQDIFAQPKVAKQKGGRVGLIQIALRSKSPLLTKIEDHGYDDLVYFNISTKISAK